MVDFIVIGAGSAGCVVAEELSTRHTVLVLEAGRWDRTPEVVIPAAFSKQFGTARDWQYYSEPDGSTAGRRLYIPRGRGIGGSGSMNAMLYMRGRPSDYDGWSEQGAEGWSWADVLPVFMSMESNSRGASEFHGDRGALIVEDQRSPNPLTRIFIEAAMEMGIPANHDFNGANQEGVGFVQVTQKRGRRWSAADAYLHPAMKRPTLDVVTEATVIRVLVEGGAAVGVEYVKNAKTHIERCESEIILAAGAIGSPQILQISGIGDANHLRSVGVTPTVHNVNVGQHMQDHVAVGVVHNSLFSKTLDGADNLLELVSWLIRRRGRLTSPIAEACAFLKSDPNLAHPDLQLHFGPAHFVDHGREPTEHRAFTLGPVLINPLARGSVNIADPDPGTRPVIVGNYLSEAQDLAALVEGLHLAREIVASSAFDTVRGPEILPGREVVTHNQLEGFIRRRVETFYHPVGTARMGEEDVSVVDPQLRVRGVEALRVVDASVMPTIVSGNTNAPTMMIASRAATMILGT